MTEPTGNLFQRLKRLFSNDVIVRHAGGKKLRVIDTDSIQNTLSNAFKDRYSRIFSTSGLGNTWGNQYGLNMAYQTQRISLFKEYDIMDEDPIIHSALDIYAQESTIENEFGDTVLIESTDDNIKDILHNLFYDILNIEFNLTPWTRNMCKYGDNFLFLEIAEGYGVVNVQPLSVYDVIRVEGEDPKNPRYTYFQTIGMNGKKLRLEDYEVAHMRLMEDSNFLPYGRAAIEGARRTWKQLTLLEDAMLIHQIMRAPEKRLIKLDVGNIPASEINTYIQNIANKMKKVPFMDPTTGDYNLRYNMMNILEDYYIPVRGTQSGTTIENLGGLDFASSTELVEYIRNRMMAALKIPKAFLGYDETVNGKLTLAAEDIRFARTIQRIQKIIVSELTKVAIVHLYAQGYRDQQLVNFKLRLTSSSAIYEQEKINLWKEKVQLATDMKNLKMVGEDWVYSKFFNMSPDEVTTQRRLVTNDVKRSFRYAQLEGGSPDPEKYGFPQDAPPDMEPDQESDAGVAENTNPVGRPRTGIKYGQDSHMRGRDPLGKKQQHDVMRHSGSRTRSDADTNELPSIGESSDFDDMTHTFLNENLLYGIENSLSDDIMLDDNHLSG